MNLKTLSIASRFIVANSHLIEEIERKFTLHAVKQNDIEWSIEDFTACAMVITHDLLDSCYFAIGIRSYKLQPQTLKRQI
jgi:hypothetical protein